MGLFDRIFGKKKEDKKELSPLEKRQQMGRVQRTGSGGYVPITTSNDDSFRGMHWDSLEDDTPSSNSFSGFGGGDFGGGGSSDSFDSSSSDSSLSDD